VCLDPGDDLAAVVVGTNCDLTHNESGDVVRD
jgi:hypothetical protein